MPNCRMGYELNIGDPVIFMAVGYRTLLNGHIKSLTAKTALIEHDKYQGKTETRQSYDQIILDVYTLSAK